MILLVTIISLIYFGLIISFIIGFNNLKIVNNKNISDKTKFSIVVPFRNEVKNLHSLFHSFSILNYDKNLFEILLVNDDSTDDFETIIENFKSENPTIYISLVSNIRKTNSPKKDAINTAIEIAQFDWIITTDADCIVPENWLKLFNQEINDNESLLICAPVKFIQQNTFLFHFQNLNFISLIGSTIGSFGINKPIMSNGANLCYNKEAFEKIDGFNGNLNIASGDDVFLLEKFNRFYPKKVHYLKSKDSIVKTSAAINFDSFMNQQIRWTSKSSAYTNKFVKFVGISVFLINLLIIGLFLTSLITTDNWELFLTVVLTKFINDFILILKTSRFLNNYNSLIYYPLTSALYPFFTVLIGIASLFKTYNWKGRNFKQ